MSGANVGRPDPGASDCEHLEEWIVVGDARWAYEPMMRQHESYIRRVARRWAPEDPVLRDDLRQTARIALWDLDASRLSATDDGKYVRAALRMAIRAEYRKQYRESGGVTRSRLEALQEEEANPLPTLMRPALLRVQKRARRALPPACIPAVAERVRACCQADMYVVVKRPSGRQSPMIDSGERGKESDSPLFIRERDFVSVATRLAMAGARRVRGVRWTKDAARTLCAALGENESYLYEEGAWVAGYLTEPIVGGEHTELRSSAWAVQVGDPLFDDARMRVLTTGCLVVDRAEGPVRIDVHAWQRFVERWGEDRHHRQRDFGMMYGRRHALKRLAELVREAEPTGRRSGMTEAFARVAGEQLYRTSGGWLFVVEGGRRVKTCYYAGGRWEGEGEVEDDLGAEEAA